MITVQVSGAKEVDAMIKNITGKIISGQRKMNKLRATKFREKVIKYVKNDELGLEPLAAITISKRYKNLGGPMYDTGELVEGQEVISRKDSSSEVGYFREKTSNHSHAKMTNWKLAVIHHTGATFKNGGRIPARPFMFVSANKYQNTNEDLNIAYNHVRDNVL